MFSWFGHHSRLVLHPEWTTGHFATSVSVFASMVASDWLLRLQLKRSSGQRVENPRVFAPAIGASRLPLSQV